MYFDAESEMQYVQTEYELEPAIGVESSSWSQVKVLFR